MLLPIESGKPEYMGNNILTIETFKAWMNVSLTDSWENIGAWTYLPLIIGPQGVTSSGAVLGLRGLLPKILFH